MTACTQQTVNWIMYDGEKLLKIREKIREVFGRETVMNDAVLSRHYNISPDGDLIMIIR
jgi:hypothetical protein